MCNVMDQISPQVYLCQVLKVTEETWRVAHDLKTWFQAIWWEFLYETIELSEIVVGHALFYSAKSIVTH